MSVYWGKYVTLLITYMDNNFSNHLALTVGHKAMYLLYFRLLLVACTQLLHYWRKCFLSLATVTRL